MDYKILFLVRDTDLNSSFIQKDIDYLREMGNTVTIYTYKNLKKNPISLIRQISLDIKIAKQCDFIFTWWLCNIYPYIISVFSHRSLFIVSGGIDVAKAPEYNYGAFLEFFPSLYVKLMVRRAKKVFVVHNSLKDELEKNLKRKLNNVIENYTAYDPEQWKLGMESREGIITVSSNKNALKTRHLVKGIDRFIELARCLPEAKFTLIGYNLDGLNKLESNIPSNLVCVPTYIPEEQLRGYYQRAEVYCQLSRREGLPSSVCEAILCGCRAVGSDVNGIPLVIGPSGFIYDFTKNDFGQFVQKFKEFYLDKKNIEDLKVNREYILRTFSIEKRKKIFESEFMKIKRP